MKRRKKKACENCGEMLGEYLLETGTGKYAEKLVCEKCENINFAEQLGRLFAMEVEKDGEEK